MCIEVLRPRFIFKYFMSINEIAVVRVFISQQILFFKCIHNFILNFIKMFIEV